MIFMIRQQKPELAWGKSKMDGPAKCNECKDEEKGEQRGGGRKSDCVD